jgi:ATP-binding cassette subfamily C protein CydD
MRTLRVAFLSSTVLEFFTSVAIAALAIYIGFSLYGAIAWGPSASLTLFSGLAILILAPEFFQPLRILSQYYHDRATALGAAHHLVTMLSGQDSDAMRKSYADTSSNAIAAPPATLTLEDLTLGYADKSVGPSSLNITVKTGEMLVVYGQSGAGKTTLLNTLAGFIEPVKGSFTITSECSYGLAYLPQSAWIKNATIRENLQALAPNASTQQMLTALEQLGLSDELDIRHNGLSSVIGEHSAGLSGGQLQRIAFARVLLNPSPVILLDEPTAKLDSHNKAFVLQAISRLRAHSMLVNASHDPDLIEMADLRMKLSEQGVGYS